MSLPSGPQHLLFPCLNHFHASCKISPPPRGLRGPLPSWVFFPDLISTLHINSTWLFSCLSVCLAFSPGECQFHKRGTRLRHLLYHRVWNGTWHTVGALGSVNIRTGISPVVQWPDNAGDTGFISGSGRSPGEGNSNPLQSSCLENPMDRETWWATVHRIAKSQT